MSPVSFSPSDRPDISGSEEITVEEEAELYLECNTWANPQVSSVLWKFNESKVDLLSGGFTVTTDGFKTNLYVHKVERSSHQGTYQCSVESPMYGAHSKIFYVTVTGLTGFDVDFLILFGCKNYEKMGIDFFYSSTSSDKTLKFPMMPIIAGSVVVFLTLVLAIASRWKRIAKVMHKTHKHIQQSD